MITVLIANSNYGQYIEKSIQSAINQTLKPTTICVVDDGSSDNSWDIISSFCTQNQTQQERTDTPNGEVLLLHGVVNDIDILGIKLPISVGPSEARNVGIQVTRQNTQYYAILDADDAMLPNKLERCMTGFKNPSVGLVYANYFNVNKDTDISLMEVKRAYDIHRLSMECIVHSGFVVKAELLDIVKDKNGYYDASMRVCEDYDLELRIAQHCSFYHIAEPLTEALVHSNNSTNSVKKEIWEANMARIRQKWSS